MISDCPERILFVSQYLQNFLRLNCFPLQLFFFLLTCENTTALFLQFFLESPAEEVVRSQMGDNKASSEVGKFNFAKWWKSGFDQGNSSNTPPPTRSTDDEENDETEFDEAGHYGVEDTRKPKYIAQGPRTHSVSALGSTVLSTTKLCARCKLDIGQGTYKEFMGAFFHPQCFCCRNCGQLIADHELLLSGASQPYHKSCYDESSYLRCDVCGRFLPMNRSGPIKYRSNPFWSQKYCEWHDYDNTLRCCSCNRLQSRDAAYVSLGDGRKLCSECKGCAMMVTSECQPLHQAVRGFMEGMKMKMNKPTSVHIVDERDINQARIDDGKPPMRHMRAYTTTRGPRIIVLLLHGLPRLDLGARLAQKLTFEWLLSIGCDDLPPELEDSICWLVAYLWLESEVKSTAYSSKKGREWEFEKKIGEFFMYRIANETRPARFGAFQATKTAVDKYGLHPTIEHIDVTGVLPR